MIVGDFNGQGLQVLMHWSSRTFAPNVSFYAKNKAELIFNFVHLFSLEVFTHNTVNSYFYNNKHDLIFMNCCISPTEVEDLVRCDKYHPLFETVIKDVASIRVKHSDLAYRYDCGDYPALYEEVKSAIGALFFLQLIWKSLSCVFKKLLQQQ